MPFQPKIKLDITLKASRYLHNYPPGPVGIPIFGSLIDLGFFPETFLTRLGVNYPEVAFCYLGNRPTLFINDLEACQPILNCIEYPSSKKNNEKDIYRAIGPAIDRPPWGDDSVGFMHDVLVSNNNENWKLRHKYCLKIMQQMLNKNFLQNNVSQSIVNNVIKELITQININRNSSTLWASRKDLSFVTFNSIFIAVFGQSADKNDKVVRDFIAGLGDIVANFYDTQTLYFLPWLTTFSNAGAEQCTRETYNMTVEF